jgi:hypothetical protein
MVAENAAYTKFRKPSDTRDQPWACRIGDKVRESLLQSQHVGHAANGLSG